MAHIPWCFSYILIFVFILNSKVFLVDLDYEDLKLFLCLISFTFKCSVINDGKFINNEYNDVYLITTLDPIPLEAFTLQVRSAIIFISWHIITLDAIIWIWFLYKWISSTLVELTLSFQFNSWFTPFFFFFFFIFCWAASEHHRFAFGINSYCMHGLL